MVVHYYFEEGKEGGWDCLIREKIDSFFHIEGHGDCWQSAFEDMKASYQKAVDYACENNLPCPDLEFMEVFVGFENPLEFPHPIEDLHGPIKPDFKGPRYVWNSHKKNLEKNKDCPDLNFEKE